MVVDTSAVLAVLLDEDARQPVEAALIEHDAVMSAATRVELGIVVEAKAGAEGTLILHELLRRFDIEVVEVDAAQAAEAVAAWRRFGKGRHPATLNYGDCFAYALAIARGEPLLYVGDDFAATDVESAL
jgi:ribonuclease VapC